MNRDELRLLIAKYEEAETSLEEEALLKKALSSADLPDEFKPYRDMFLLYEAASEVSMDKNYRADDFNPPPFSGMGFQISCGYCHHRQFIVCGSAISSIHPKRKYQPIC